MSEEKVQKRVARRKSRIIALEAIFAYLSREGDVTVEASLQHVLKYVEEVNADDFAEKIVRSAFDNLAKIRVIIRSLATEFDYEKIAPINRALLVLGVGEMKFLGTPPVVVINEYIELAKDFGEDKSAGFINGVLDNYRKSLGLDR
jgi:N utilization substance protein B